MEMVDDYLERGEYWIDNYDDGDGDDDNAWDDGDVDRDSHHDFLLISFWFPFDFLLISYWFPIDDLPNDSYDDYDADLYADDNDDDSNNAGYDRWWCW